MTGTELVDRVKTGALDKKWTREEFRVGIVGFERELMKVVGAVVAHNALVEGMCPLKHTFADGVYIREIFMPKGTLLTSKIHKTNHPYFIMKGDVSVATEEGIVRLVAPYSGITKAGTKRLLYMHEDTVWITVHATPYKDVLKIEEEIIARDFNEIDQLQIEINERGVS